MRDIEDKTNESHHSVQRGTQVTMTILKRSGSILLVFSWACDAVWRDSGPRLLAIPFPSPRSQLLLPSIEAWQAMKAEAQHSDRAGPLPRRSWLLGAPWMCGVDFFWPSHLTSPVLAQEMWWAGRRAFGSWAVCVTSALCFIFTVQSTKCHVITRLDYLYSEAKEGKG